jgi:hypothetical protein
MEINATILIGGEERKLTLRFDSEGQPTYRQYGAHVSQLESTQGLAELLADALGEWATDELCRTCHDALLDDGEGYDGECGDCADKTEARRSNE